MLDQAVSTGLALELSAAAYRTRRGYVFEPVSLTAQPSQIVVVAGPSGSGRTALALAVCGRMKYNEGSIAVGGQELPGAQRWVRQNSCIGPDNGFAEFEDGLKVIEEARRAHWLVGKHHRTTPEQVIELAGLAGYENFTIRRITAMQRARLAVVCAFVADVGLVVIDDFARGIPRDQQADLWQLLVRCQQQFGPTVFVTALEAGPARDYATTVVEITETPGPPDSVSPATVVVN